MRAPGFLGWDREEEFMDWREVSRKGQEGPSAASSSLTGSSSSSKSARPRRRSREETRSRTREAGSTFEYRREETRSIDRLECKSSNDSREVETGDIETGHAVMKSRSASSVDTWKAEIDGGGTPTRLPNNSSSLSGDDSRARVKRCAKVVSSTTMEKWKETTRCETRSKALAPEDLKTPLRLDEVVLDRKEGSVDAEDRLQNNRSLDEVHDDELPAFIGNLLVSVERKIERVSLDDLTFPCPACRNIDTDDPLLGCRCAGDDCSCGAGEDTCDCAPSKTRKEQSRSFEVAGIKHIDSDDEEEVRMGFGECTLTLLTNSINTTCRVRARNTL